MRASVTLVFIFFFFTTFEIPAWLMLLYWFVIQFFSGVGTIGYSHRLAGRHGVLRAYRRIHRGNAPGRRDGDAASATARRRDLYW